MDPQRRNVDGNERLTAITGAVLIVLLAVEGVTILRIGQLLTLHAFVAILLIGPLTLKLLSTGYRFTRYYTGDPAYRRKGPPHPALRAMAPVLVAATLAVWGTGIAILFVGRSGQLVFLHKASFVVWIALATVHVLAYALRVLTSLEADLLRRRSGVRGRSLRIALVSLGVVGGLLIAGASLDRDRGLHGHEAGERDAVLGVTLPVDIV